MNVIDLLRIQHQEAKRLLARVEAATDDDKPLWLKELADHLRAHFAAEERVVYPVAFRARTRDLHANAVDDNRSIHFRVNELAATPPTSRRFGERLRIIKEEFERHVIDEEDLLFVLQGRLDVAVLAKLGRDLAIAYQQTVHGEVPVRTARQVRATLVME